MMLMSRNLRWVFIYVQGQDSPKNNVVFLVPDADKHGMLWTFGNIVVSNVAQGVQSLASDGRDAGTLQPLLIGNDVVAVVSVEEVARHNPYERNREGACSASRACGKRSP